MKDGRQFLVSALFLWLTFISSGSGLQNKSADPAAREKQSKPKNGRVVYVCACLKDRSCSCMTEAKMEGPCACGTEGGPPMKSVPANSDWAKQNRDALAK